MDVTRIAVEIFDKYAKQYQDKFMDVDYYSHSLNFFCDAIAKQNATILEIACGPGNITKYLLNKRPDFKLLGIDLSLNMIELAKMNNPTAGFQIMDCREIGSIDKKYDAIMCGFCLPYLSKEEAIEFIFNASKILNTNGILYLSTMEDDYTKSGFKKGSNGDEMFMYYHQADYLTKALEENQFRILFIERKESFPLNTTDTKDLIIIAGKSES